MELNQIISTVQSKMSEHGREFEAFEAEAERGQDLFESWCGMKYHQGQADAFREILELLGEPVCADENSHTPDRREEGSSRSLQA